MASTISLTTSTDAGGNTYTTSVSNDSLTTNDFLKPIIEQLKLQDPIKPYDSAKMLETQMQMPTLNANTQMTSTLESISTAFQQTSISNAAGLIGSSIENGSRNSSGSLESYYVESIENVDGSLTVKGRELLYAKDKIQLDVDGEVKIVNYDDSRNIYNEKGEKAEETLVLDSIGQSSVGTDGKLKVKDANGKEVSGHNYELVGTYTLVCSTELTDIPYSSITRIST